MEHTFTVTAKATSGVSQSWVSEVESGSEAKVSIPGAFEGPGEGYSPEDFFAMALLNCWLATFKVVAQKSKFEFRSLEGKATITSGKNSEGALWIPKVHMELVLTGTDDQDKAHRLLEVASKHCLILNSVKTEKTYEIQILE